MHTNLFQNGHTRTEVKEALKEHQKRDNTTLRIIDVVFGVCLVYLIRNLPMWDAIAIFVGAFSVLSGIRYFIDQSVRNFYLHRLDWEDSKPDDMAS